MNNIAIQKLIASSKYNGGVFGSGCLRHFLSNKTRDCVKGLSVDVGTRI
jgi:hypothetical protein